VRIWKTPKKCVTLVKEHTGETNKNTPVVFQGNTPVVIPVHPNFASQRFTKPCHEQ